MIIGMELRSVDFEERTVTGVVVPYDETTYLVPGGERIRRNAFNRSITQRGNRIPLCIDHDHRTAVGFSREWDNTSTGLIGVFAFRETDEAQRALVDTRDGVFPDLSVGFLPVDHSRAADGVSEIREGRLIETSLCMAGAYAGARVLAVRGADELARLMAPFSNPPMPDLSPVPLWV